MRKWIRRLAHASALAGSLLVAADALAADPPAAPRKWRYVEGQLLTLISPAYPETSLARGETSTIEVTGKIQPDGSLASVTIWSEPPSVFLEEAVRKVVPHWRFQPRVESPSCQFRETSGRATIWFEIAGTKPKVSYSVVKPESKGLSFAPILTDRVPTRTLEPRVPEGSARNPGIPDVVLQVAYVGILADGTVHRVSVAPLPYAHDYGASLRAALMQWRFEPADRAGCMEIDVKFQRE